MKLISFREAGEMRTGALVRAGEETRVADLNRTNPGIPADMLALLSGGAGVMATVREAVSRPERCVWADSAGLQWAAPVPRPGKILCLGHNYRGHIGQGRTEPPEYPNVFAKTSNTVIGPGEAIVIPPETREADFEAELAVVLGRRARRVDEDGARECIAGYTIFNDVSARDIQRRGSQWAVGKSLDTFGPMGPALVTADEVPDPHSLALELSVNGTVRQRANTRDQIFTIPFLIRYLSAWMTLEPGDVIATGTPARLPPPAGGDVFLRSGDTIRIAIERIGELINPVRAEGADPR